MVLYESTCHFYLEGDKYDKLIKELYHLIDLKLCFKCIG